MRAAAIFFLARVIRAAIVASLTRKARATSAVVSPHTSRSVSATWASVAERRVAAGEDQPQAVVGDLVRAGRRRPAGRARLRLVDAAAAGPGARWRRGAAGRSPAAGRRWSARRPGLAGMPRRGPGGQRPGVGVLHALLGQVEVAR